VWDRFEHTNWKARYVDTGKIPFLYQNLHISLGVDCDDAGVRQRLEANAGLLNRLAVELARHVIGPPERATTTDCERTAALLAALPDRIRELYLSGESFPEMARDLERIWLEESATMAAGA
jgi:hypothetical protein